MAFDAVTTLIKIVGKDLVVPKVLSIFDVGGMKVSLLAMIELLSAKLCFLQAFLEECKTKMNDGDICAKILYEAIQHEVARRYEKYRLESKVTLLCLAANYRETVLFREVLHKTLKQVVRDIEEVGEWTLEIKKRIALEPEEENIRVWDTSQNALLEHENEVIVGFDDDIEKIISLLSFSHSMRSVLTILRNSKFDVSWKYVENSVPNLQVIPLVGEGGIGKTTLATRVYGHPITIASFHIRAWVVVSQVHDLKEMLIGLLRCISPITSEIYNIDDAQIAKQLCKSLMGQKYLIFLDDIWTIAAWDAIQGCFPENFNGSRILATTRFTMVAEYLSADPYHVKYQTFEDRWELFSRKVFGQSQCVPREYELIGKRIVLGCSGLPLAVVVIAGLLDTE